MNPLDGAVRKIFRPSVTVSDANLLSAPSGKSLKQNLRTISGIVSQSNSSSSSCFDIRKDRKISNLLKIYFDFTYYIGCSPFHFVSDRNGNFLDCEWYRIQTWKPQQFTCAVLHILGIFRLFTEVRGILPTKVLYQSPERYFAITGGVLRILFKVITIKRFWYNQKQFLDILNFMAVEKNLPDCRLKIQSRYTLSILYGLFLLMPVIFALKNNIIAPPSTWNNTSWDRRLVSDGRFAFFIISRADYNPNGTTTIPDAAEISALDSFLGFFTGVGLVERLIMGFYFDAALLCGVLTLWTTSYAFSRNLVKGSGMDDQVVWANLSSSRQKLMKESMFGGMSAKSEIWTKLYESYKGIRALSQLINDAFGSMITIFLAESILYHSMNLDAVVLTEDVFAQAHLLFFVVSSSLTFLYAADICSQMDSLKTWLAKDENRKCIPLDELNIVLHELQTNVIGIRGSNIFTITYSLVWNMLTTVVTYFIICMQARVVKSGGY